MSDLLYPTELNPHPQPGDLAAFRDGLFGRRGSAPYGEGDGAFENGVFGPGLGRGMRGLRGHDANLLDSGPHQAFRDGIFNFPRRMEDTPHPVTSFQDGIFGGASLGTTAEASTPVSPAETPAAAPSVTVQLDMTKPAVVTELVHFLLEGAAALGYDTGVFPFVDKASWDRDCSVLLVLLVDQAAANNPPQAEAIQQYSIRRVGDLACPTPAFLYMFAASAATAGYVMNPAAYPALSSYLTTCAVNMFTGTAPTTAEEAVAKAEAGCPIKYPVPRIARAAMYAGGAAVVGGLLYLVLRK